MKVAAAVALGMVAVAVAAAIFRNDLGNDPRTRVRALAEAALPLLGLVALVTWAWLSL